MDANDILNRIIDIMAVDVDSKIRSVKVQGDTKLYDLGVNSMSFIKLTVKLEQEFGIEFGNRDLDHNKFPVMDDLVSYIQNKSV